MLEETSLRRCRLEVSINIDSETSGRGLFRRPVFSFKIGCPELSLRKIVPFIANYWGYFSHNFMWSGSMTNAQSNQLVTFKLDSGIPLVRLRVTGLGNI